jgi:hypothetical protein
MPEKPKNNVTQFPIERTKEGREKADARMAAVMEKLGDMVPLTMREKMLIGSAEMLQADFDIMNNEELDNWIDEHFVKNVMSWDSRSFADQAKMMIGGTEYLKRNKKKK